MSLGQKLAQSIVCLLAEKECNGALW